jgi:hypothetical protein
VEAVTITDFLLARIAEDEAAAERGRRHNATETFANDNYGCLLVDPARVLAECEAKYRLVVSGDTWTHCVLATVYADHEDYRPEWRP